MSKRALSLLLKEVTKKDDVTNSIAGSSKDYRKGLLDKNKQIFELGTVSYIADELRQEILATEPSLLQGGLVTPQDLLGAASALRNSFMSKVKPDNILDSSAGIVVYNTYDPMAKNLSLANKAAFTYLERVVSSKNGNTGSLNPSLTSPDHVRASADIRFTQVFYNKLPNPTEALRALKDYGNLSQDSYSAFLTQYEEITSYYTKGEKIFDLSIGAELKLKSKKANESAGGVTKAVTDSIRAAVDKAIVNRNWADQSGSDSYKDALFKELNNILVKGGATGKKQTVDSAKNSIKQVSKQAIKVRKYKPGTPATKLGKKKPLINLQAIVSYINSKLPEAVRANMGEPALVNRTGRFSNSARITGAQLTPQGYPSLSYTYQRSPYDVFDPFLGKKPWNTPGRNPRTLVEKSVRDVARDLAIGRFYLRRV